MQTYTSYMAVADEELCNACGVCVGMCPMEALSLEGDAVVVDDSRCIGCGVCSYHCAGGALSLRRTGIRQVFAPPRRLG